MSERASSGIPSAEEFIETVFARTTLVPKGSLRRSSQGTWDYDLDELNEFYEENPRIEQMGL